MFTPRTSQVIETKSGQLYCCRDHYLRAKHDNAISYFHGYRPYIIERDDRRCKLCGTSDQLHVHHIETRGSGGTDEYLNLITLCGNCHRTKAHGFEGAAFKILFVEMNAGLDRPDFWDDVMEQSTRDRQKVKETNRKQRKHYYNRLKESGAYAAYREKWKEKQKARDQLFKEKHGCSYGTFRRREAKRKKLSSPLRALPTD